MKKRNDGRYEKKVYLGTENGIPKYKTVYGKTKKECDIKAAEIKVQNNKGIEILSGDQSSFTFWAECFEKKLELTSTPNQLKLLKTRLSVWKDIFKDTPIDKINTVDVEKALSKFAKKNPYCNKPSSAKTLKEYRSVLSRVFDFCLQNRVLTFNPVSYVNQPKASKKIQREPLTDKEIECFRTVEHKLQLICLIMIYCGLRRGEATCINWNDLADGKVIISKAADVRAGKVKKPKTEAGIRTVPIPDILFPYLNKAKKEYPLVLSQEGKMFNNTDWEREWKEYLKKIYSETGVKITKTIHCLRHTYCTLLYESGIDVLTAKEFMGHSDIQTTMAIYTHFRQERELSAIEKLNNYIGTR